MLTRLNLSLRERRKALLALGTAVLLSSCGGSGGGGGGNTGGGTSTPAPTPTSTQTTAAECSLRARQDWALAQLQEWYLFPSLLNVQANPASYTDLQSYIDALVAPARAQNRDRHFTYVTSIAQENAFYDQGSTAGFGIRLQVDNTNRRLFISEAFEGGPALAAGIDRGSEILAIGTQPSNMVAVATYFASGSQTLQQALGPDQAGTTRLLSIRDQTGVTRTVTLTKADFALDPVSNRYGAKIITEGTRRIGYLNLRNFIDTAEPDLRAAFADFKVQGVTELIVDLRYNGGGLINVADLMIDLMAAIGRDGQPSGYVAYRDSKVNMNSTFTFATQPQSIAVTKVAFIGTGSTASASELVINGMVPFLRSNLALVGSNTYGKPVGQIALDRPACDDRLRAVAIKIENADRQGEYYSGLATTVPNTCRATDDLTRQLGDPAEAMTRVALDFLAGRACTAIGAIGTASAPDRGALMPEVPQSTVQREVPGAY